MMITQVNKRLLNSLIKEENSLEEKEKGKTEANKKRSKRYVKGNKNKG